MEKNIKLKEITRDNEIKKFITNKYVFADDGMNEIIIARNQIPDYIITRNTDLKFYDSDGEFLLSTIGVFLDKCKDLDVRNEFIERLVKLQTYEESANHIKFINEDTFEEFERKFNEYNFQSEEKINI